MRRLAPSLFACLLLFAACGKEKEPPRRVFEVKPPKGQKHADFTAVGMAFNRPRNWRLRPKAEPEVFEMSSGEAAIAGWAYRRDEDLPETDGQLDAAKGRLVDAIEERDPDFRLESAETGEVAGSPALDVRGSQVISRRRLNTRSVHIFKGDVEYVIEALAPPPDARLVDTRVLEPLLDSLTLEGEVREGEE